MRTIDKLRRIYPGRWTYDADMRHWRHEDGWYVYRCAALAPRWDGDDDSFDVHFRRSDTGERLNLDFLLLTRGAP